MRSIRSTLFALVVASLSLPAIAQPGPGAGPGAGARQGGGFRFNQDNTRGWALMTDQERVAHRDKMLSFKTYDECKAYQVEHHALMEARAKEKGTKLLMPRNNACDRMKASGLLK